MGLIKAIGGALGGTLADQWKEYFYCDALPATTLVVKGQKRTSGRSSNTRGSENIISSGSVIAVADGQCMIIVEQGKVAEICAEPGEFTYDASTEPTIFSGDLGDSIGKAFATVGKRFTFGGEPPKDQRVYYFNTKELIGNKYGTPSPIPFKIIDKDIGMKLTVSLSCFGEYSYRVTNPILFYTNVCGNVDSAYTRDQIDSQLKTELLTALQPVFARLSESCIEYTSIPGHTAEMASELNKQLSSQWRDLRGIEIVAFGVSSIRASEEDEKRLKELQRNATFRDPTMAAAQMVGAQAAAMQAAAENQGAGPAMAFMGMNMAGAAGGVNAQNLYQMGQQQAAAAPPAAAQGWTCSCGHAGNTGKFCAECGAPRPEPAADGWICQKCGAKNKGKFCAECGEKKPAGVPQYKCDKCGWEPPDPAHPPKFCPECGDPFDDGDIS